MEGELARPAGSIYKDYYQITVQAIDANGDDYKTLTGVKWYVLEAMPTPDLMDDEMLQSHIDSLTAEIAALKF
jgi:hypothetical protein